ncbi:hypothetical protein [Aquitalea pelogenes]|uniref:hypothetical protein n=1 Tax=Aquitalea pelogenes TaxID=1293573 RepID=UPI0035B1D5F8
MNYAEKKKLEAAANKILREAGKKKPKVKNSPGSKLPFKVFAQTSGHFLPGQMPLVCQIKTLSDLAARNRQLGRLEFLPNKTYFKANLKQEGIYFYTNLELVMKKDFYYKAGSSGFFTLTSDGKINPITEEEAQKSIDN